MIIILFVGYTLTSGCGLKPPVLLHLTTRVILHQVWRHNHDHITVGRECVCVWCVCMYVCVCEREYLS